MFYTSRNFVIAFGIVVAVILLILLNTFYTFVLQQKEIRKVRMAREVLFKLEPAQIHAHDLEDRLTLFLTVEKSRDTNFFHEALISFNTDSSQIAELINSDSLKQNKTDYHNLLILFTQLKKIGKDIIQHKIVSPDPAKLESEKESFQKIVAGYKMVSEKLQANNRRILRESFGQNVSLSRKAFVFTGIISGILILILITGFFFRYKNIRYRSIYDFNLQKFRNALNNSADALYIIDRSRMKFIDVNDSSCSSTGYSREELLSAGPQHLSHQQTEALAREYDEIINSPMKKGMLYARFFRKDDSSFETEISVQAMKDGKKDILITVVRDITERKKAEEQLREFNEKLEKQVKEKTAEISRVFDRVTDAFVALDKNWCYTYLNEKAELMHGRKAKDLIGKNIWTEFPDVVHEPLYHALHESMQLQKPQRLQLYYSTMNKWFEDLIYPSADGVSVYYHDITERKKAEIKLSESEEKYRMVIEQASDGIFIADQDMYIVDANNAGCKMLGYTSDELRKMKFIDLILPSTLQNNPIRLNELNKGISVLNERRLLKKDGSEILIEISAKKLSDQRYQSIIRDITERKKTEQILRESEKQLSIAAQIAKLGYWEYDTIKDLFTFSDQFYSIFRTTAEKVGGYQMSWEQYAEKFIHPDDINIVKAETEKALSTGDPYSSRQLEHRMVYADGETGYITVNFYIVKDDHGRIIKKFGVNQDITERKKVEQEVLEYNKRFELITRTTNDAVWDWNFETNKLWANEMHQHLYGLTLADPIPTVDMWAERIHPDDKNVILKKQEDTLASDQNIFVTEYRFRTKNSGYRNIYDRSYILRDKSGKPVRMMGSMMDITELKQAEQTIRTVEETRRLIMNSALDAIICINDKGLIIVWTPQAEKIFGWKESEVLGKGLTETIIPLHYREKHLTGFNKYKQTKETSVMNRLIEITALDKKGREFPVELSITPIRQGDTEFFCAFMRDITERKKVENDLKESEERYRILVENAAEALVVFDMEKRKFVSVSESAAKLFKLSKEKLLNFGPIELSPEFQPDGTLSSVSGIEKLNDAVAGNKPAFEWTHCDADGNLIPCEVRLVRLPSENKILIRGSIIDITERKKAQLELEQSYESIRYLTDHLQNIREQERIHIAREIHDELGQQLTVLKMDISWLNKKIAPVDNAVKQKLKSLTEMLNGTVKTVRRISSELRPSLLDDLGLVAAMEWQLKEFEERFGIKAIFVADETEIELPDSIKTGFFRIFQESLTNIARHANAKHVSASLKSSDQEIILCIEDDGKGFDNKKIEGKRTLGILGMKERTLMMGGEYSINSIPGRGTTVLVVIPANNI